ncbi:MAG: lysophospholipid acyltransferase family protein [Desulfobacterales bacterium]|jgi:1-acyl-sn-glycerol-3-phosphate acyltransferase
MIRTAYIILCVVLETLFFGIIAMGISFFTRTGNPVHLVARLWARSILFVSRIKVTVNGLSNVDPSKSFIYMSNHQSNFDIPVLLAYIPGQFRWLAKAELFKIPIFGHGMRGAGYISIDRFNRDSAFQSIDQAAKKIKGGVSVMIFPEGTRSKDGRIRPFKKGGFIMALNSGVPIVPVIVRGTWPIMSKDSLRINRGNVYLDIKQPIDTHGYTRDNKQLLIDRVRAVICEGFKED